MNIGEYLRFKREEKRLTIARVADFVGVSESTVSRWERGMIGEMGRTKIAKLSEILEISPAVIVGFDDLHEEGSVVQTQTFTGNVAISNGSISQNANFSTRDLLEKIYEQNVMIIELLRQK